jgi:hypothetical protein
MNLIFTFSFLAVAEEQIERGIEIVLTTKSLNIVADSA